MKLRHLESSLSDVDVFEEPKVDLEQVPTSPHIAARMLFSAMEQGDIDSCMVGDFGVGTGMLSIASKFCGASHVVGVDIDQDALDTAWVNLKKNEIDDIDLINCDVQRISFSWGFDTVVMNPPFGTRHAGIDTAFLEKGMENARVVYSLHKTSTRPHFVRLAEANNWGFEVVAELRYDIPKTHKFHKQKSKDIEVDLYRVFHVN